MVIYSKTVLNQNLIIKKTIPQNQNQNLAVSRVIVIIYMYAKSLLNQNLIVKKNLRIVRSTNQNSTTIFIN